MLRLTSLIEFLIQPILRFIPEKSIGAVSKEKSHEFDATMEVYLENEMKKKTTSQRASSGTNKTNLPLIGSTDSILLLQIAFSQSFSQINFNFRRAIAIFFQFLSFLDKIFVEIVLELACVFFPLGLSDPFKVKARTA